MYESKLLNVKIMRPKIHFIPDVVYSQVETLESPNKLLKMDAHMGIYGLENLWEIDKSQAFQLLQDNKKVDIFM